MKELQVNLRDGRNYPIYIGSNLRKKTDLFRQHINSRQVAVITNETIAALYLPEILAVLNDYQTEAVILPDGEQFKTLSYLKKFLTAYWKKNSAVTQP